MNSKTPAPLFLLLILAVSASAGGNYTREEVVKILNEGKYGAINWNTPRIVEWYMNAMNTNPETLKERIPLVYMNRNETLRLNSTHDVEMHFMYYANIFNITKEHPPEKKQPTDKQRLVILCSARFKADFVWARYSHESALNTSLAPNFTRPRVPTNTGDNGTTTSFVGFGCGQHMNMTNASTWQAYESCWVQDYTDYAAACDGWR